MFPSTSSLLSLYASFSTSAILLRNAYREIVPRFVADYVSHKLRQLFFKAAPVLPDTDSIIIDKIWNNNCYDGNELFDAVRYYLSTKMGPENKQFRVAKLKNSNRFTTALVGGETVVDVFEGDVFSWYLPSMNNRRRSGLVGGLIQGGDADDMYCSPDDCYRLSFRTENREKALNHYLRHVVKVFEEMSQQLQLFTWSSSGSQYYGGSSWTSMDSRHPMTFDTIALDAKMKQGIVGDLDRFVARREFYKRVGKAWKRGYLLYGPPGTGKSSVVSAMSNHLKFNLYVVELANFGSDYELRHTLLSIANKSIVVFEDIDCCPELHARSESTKASDESSDDNTRNDGSHHHLKRKSPGKFTLSTLLNCIDGLWSSHGEERIIVFTTNHKDVLDPALIRPGRMDMQIHLSYCTPEAFRSLAAIYLEVKGNHPLFEEIDGLLEIVEVTPAALAEELMKGSDVDEILQQVVDFLKQKKLGTEREESDEG